MNADQARVFTIKTKQLSLAAEHALDATSSYLRASTSVRGKVTSAVSTILSPQSRGDLLFLVLPSNLSMMAVDVALASCVISRTVGNPTSRQRCR